MFHVWKIIELVNGCCMVSLQMGLDQLVAPSSVLRTTAKAFLKTGNILHNWNDTVKDRVKWRSMIKTVSDKLNISRKRKYERARERRKR